MKKIFIIVALVSFSIVQSQNFEKKDLMGQWMFKIEIKDAIKNSKDLNGFEKLAARTFSRIIEKELEKVQMIFDFKRDNTASITVITEEKTEKEEQEEAGRHDIRYVMRQPTTLITTHPRRRRNEIKRK